MFPGSTQECSRDAMLSLSHTHVRTRSSILQFNRSLNIYQFALIFCNCPALKGGITCLIMQLICLSWSNITHLSFFEPFNALCGVKRGFDLNLGLLLFFPSPPGDLPSYSTTIRSICNSWLFLTVTMATAAVRVVCFWCVFADRGCPGGCLEQLISTFHAGRSVEDGFAAGLSSSGGQGADRGQQGGGRCGEEDGGPSSASPLPPAT